MKLPIQPIIKDEHDTLRFQRNEVVRYLLDHGGIDLNQLALIGFPQADQEQFAQLIGYSLSGFGELDYASKETCDLAEEMASNLAVSEDGDESAMRASYWENKYIEAREKLRELCIMMFGTDPE